jgi:hypothetical protein
LEPPKTEIQLADEAAAFNQMKEAQRQLIEDKNAEMADMRVKQDLLSKHLAKLEADKKAQ